MRQLAPDLLLYPILDEAEALTGACCATRWSRSERSSVCGTYARGHARARLDPRRGAPGRPLELYGYREGFTAYQQLIGQWGAWIIIAKSLTPIPFKIMAIAAGVAAMSPSAFLASAVVGRALHFAIVASLIALWGDRVMALVSGYGRMLAVFSVLLLLGIAVAYHLP